MQRKNFENYIGCQIFFVYSYSIEYVLVIWQLSKTDTLQVELPDAVKIRTIYGWFQKYHIEEICIFACNIQFYEKQMMVVDKPPFTNFQEI